MSNTYSILLPESLHGYQRFLHTQRPILLGGFPTFFENFEKKVEYFPNIFPKVKSPTRTPIYTPQSILSLHPLLNEANISSSLICLSSSMKTWKQVAQFASIHCKTTLYLRMSRTLSWLEKFTSRKSRGLKDVVQETNNQQEKQREDCWWRWQWWGMQNVFLQCSGFARLIPKAVSFPDRRGIQQLLSRQNIQNQEI